MVTLVTKSNPLRTIAGIRPPDSRIAREAEALARAVSTPVLYNHVMRTYFLGELVATAHGKTYDQEIVLVSLVLHDLGFTDHARGPRRFEIEGADAARRFALEHGMTEDKAWLVWDNIALHPLDINEHKEPEAQAVEFGIGADVLGFGLDKVAPAALAELLAAYPRLGLKRALGDLLRQEAEAKPHSHPLHPSTMIAHHCLGGVHIPDAQALMNAAPFDD